MIFQWLKRYMPRSLYGRAALILLLPVICVQLVVSVVFTQRHFEDVTLQMSTTVTRELRLVLNLADQTSEPNIAEAIKAELEPLQMNVRVVDEAVLTQSNQRKWFDFSGRIIMRELLMNVPELRVIDLSQDKTVRLIAQTRSAAIEIGFDRRRVSAKNPHQLFVNMVFYSVLITVVALIYLRNQLRPIKRLAQASEAFGRGRHDPYTPAGATEVRAAGAAFVDMRQRIERQIETRTLMLSGVSHDLRTPLTRMRLELSLMDEDIAKPILHDVEAMQQMIDEFLNFTRSAGEGTSESVDAIELAKSVVSEAQRAGQDVTLNILEGKGDVMLREGAMRRALDNLISNAVRYGGRAEVSVQVTDKSLRLRVEDPGPGIPEAQRAEAQKPFTRLDPSRNQDRGSGVGLGLAIATDIARAHGGVLRLGTSESLGGLRADIVIAR
ncbi:MAG: ATP-binding protein [Paracoccaceae bacterium]